MVHVIPVDARPYLGKWRRCSQWFFGKARSPIAAAAELYGNLVYVLVRDGKSRAEAGAELAVLATGAGQATRQRQPSLQDDGLNGPTGLRSHPKRDGPEPELLAVFPAESDRILNEEMGCGHGATMITNTECVDHGSTAQIDDLSREVYCILGVPIDAIEMPGIMQRIEMAAAGSKPFVISTPNLNFLVSSQADQEFRESLLVSNLCPADGMPIVWIARIVGIPIRNRVAGSDIFQMLKAHHGLARPLKVFFFGGADGVAAKACSMLNEECSGLRCVGTMYPGFGSIEELSRDEIIKTINASEADFLVTSLGALKGQLWLLRNQHRLQISIRAHFGAVVNFQAGVIRRAPRILRKFGLEWLWRIKEEPHLWRRYLDDGMVLVRVLLTRILPLAIRTRAQQIKYRGKGPEFTIRKIRDNETVTLSLCGFATASQVAKAMPIVREAVTEVRKMILDLSETRAIDPRFFGFLLMVRKRLKEKGVNLAFTGVSSRLEKMFRLNGVCYLLSSVE